MGQLGRVSRALWIASVLLAALSLHSMLSVLASMGGARVAVYPDRVELSSRAENRGVLPVEVKVRVEVLGPGGSEIGEGEQGVALPPLGRGLVALSVRSPGPPSALRIGLSVSAGGLASVTIESEVTGG